MPATQGREELLTAPVEQGPSQDARSWSKERSSRPCPHSPRPCVARGQTIISPPSPPLFWEYRTNVGGLPIIPIVRVPRAGGWAGYSPWILGGLQMQFRLHSLEHQELQERLTGDTKD